MERTSERITTVGLRGPSRAETTAASLKSRSENRVPNSPRLLSRAELASRSTPRMSEGVPQLETSILFARLFSKASRDFSHSVRAFVPPPPRCFLAQILQ